MLITCFVIVTTILDKSPWDSDALINFLGSLIKHMSFSKISRSSTSPNLYNVQKKLRIHASNVVWRIVNMCELKTRRCGSASFGIAVGGVREVFFFFMCIRDV